VYSGRVLEYFREVGASVVIPYRWVVKTGFCQRDFNMANEQQRHLKENLISELLEKGESIKTS
jgi:hypothetical protein